MAQRYKCPIALTIAGSDSGGGAGIQADLNTFAALGVHGTTAITCLTAQNPKGVLVRQQLEAVFAELPPGGCKTGMLFSAEIILEVAEFFGGRKQAPPLVVDPVMIATSGAALIKPAAVRALTTRLLPGAALVTPNLPEAETLLGSQIRSEEDMRQAARECLRRFGCPALIKGGHLPGREAVDIFFDGKNELLLSAPRIGGLSLHGTGCTYSAAIAAFLARGDKLPAAVSQAKEFITTTIARSRRVAGHRVLNWVDAR
jgi:hydroxymethylpyrimidine/phosphomethylpyrimidine kinase